MKELILLRGLPGSGKSTLAKSLAGSEYPIYSADMFFEIDFGTYKFDPAKLKYAHEWCQNRVRVDMEAGVKRIFVANTFTQDWEMEHYYMLAEVNGYRVHSVIVENRHGSTNIHDVPPDSIDKMKARFEIKL